MLQMKGISKSFTLQSCGSYNYWFLTNSCSGTTLYIGSEKTKFYDSIHAAEVRKCVNLHDSLFYLTIHAYFSSTHSGNAEM